MTVTETVTAWLDESKLQIISNYDRDKMRASGKFADSLRVDVKETSSTVTGILYGANHSLFVDQGRGKTSKSGSGTPLRELILQWIEDKNITPRDNISKQSLAFLISRKIHREGWRPKHTPPNGVITSVINQKRIDELIISLSKSVATNVKSELWQQLG